MRHTTVPALLLLLAGACTPPAGEPAATVDVAAGEQAAAAFWAAFTAAERAMDADAVANMYHEAVQIDVKGAAPIMGRAALLDFIRQAWQGMTINTLDITPQYTNVVTNDLVHQAGSYTESLTRDGAAATEYGRFASALGRDTDGQWRIMYLMAMTDSTVAR